MSNIIDNLMAMELPCPQERSFALPRLGLTLRLREISYDRVIACRREEDASLHYILAGVLSPNFRAEEFYSGKMGCATPVAALKKLLRPGEIERLAKELDRLNGYLGGSVMELSESDLEDGTAAAALEELKKNA